MVGTHQNGAAQCGSRGMKIATSGCVRGGLQSLTGVRIAHLIETDGPGGAERMLSLLAAELQSVSRYAEMYRDALDRASS